MSVRRHESLVVDQFGPQAAAYLTSQVHASGDDLDAIAAAVPAGTRRALDIGCGGGHVTYRLAASVPDVVACDLSEAMLTQVADEARRRGFAIRTKQASAESLPFADAAFDLVASRYSAHHWADLDAGLAEARRVLRPGGIAVFADVVAPDAPLLDTVLQTLEILRDPSHVRDRSVAEWRDALARAGFPHVTVQHHRLRLDFRSWVERMRTPEVFVEAIRALQDTLSDAARQHFELQPDGSFTIDTATLVATG